MLRVLVVDDEIAAREAIRAAVPWGELGFELAGETADGELALSLLRAERPDVLITDIRMPYMDGMELCRRVRREMPGMRIVIVSACEDFACAREAISLGVRAYLQKPVQPAALREVLSRIAEELREERARRERERTLRNYLAASGRFFRERLLEELYGGADAEDVLRAGRAMQMNLSAKRYLALAIQPDAALDERELRALHDALERVAAARGETAFLRREGGAFSLLVLGDGERHLRARAEGLAAAAQREAKRAVNAELEIAVGESVERLADAPASLADARARLGKAQQEGAIEAREIPAGAIRPEGLDLPPLPELLRGAGPADVEEIVARRAEALGADRSEVLAVYLYVEALLAAARIARDGQGSLAEVVPDALRARGGVDALLSLTRDALRRALEFRDSRGSARYGAVIRRARAYIDERFADPGLALRDVAAHVALSGNHFCTVFSREMGVTFSEYLTDLRIRRAKEMLRDTNLRTSEIAYAVGYNDPHYFSNLFKKVTGYSPRDFRKLDSVN